MGCRGRPWTRRADLEEALDTDIDVFPMPIVLWLSKQRAPIGKRQAPEPADRQRGVAYYCYNILLLLRGCRRGVIVFVM